MPYQTTHNTGGTIMGDNPKNSVVNKYLQSWDVPNVFSSARARFRRTPATIRPARWRRSPIMSAEAIKSQYLKAPGPLVRG